MAVKKAQLCGHPQIKHGLRGGTAIDTGVPIRSLARYL